METPNARLKATLSRTSDPKPQSDAICPMGVFVPRRRPQTRRLRLLEDAALAAGPAALDLGRVGETARLRVNGRDAGRRVAPPYRFRLDGLLRHGGNELVVETAGTLARRLRDDFSAHLLLPPTGLLGPLVILRP